MIHIKEILMVILSAVGVAAVAVFVMMIDSLPMTVLLIVAAFLWVLLLFLVVRDSIKRHRKPTLWMVEDGNWVAQDGSGRSVPMLRRNNSLFDQDEPIKYKDEA